MRLAEIRKSRGMTQQMLADAVGVWQTTIGNYEAGVRYPNSEMLKKLSSVLHCTVDEILEDPVEEQHAL